MMKRTIATFAFVMALHCGGVRAYAAPYFRVIDLNHPYIMAGAYVNPFVLKESAGGSAVALLTHSPKDGCLFPSVVCEDWTPFALGFSGNSGKYLIGMGPSFNVNPVVKALALKALKATTKGGTLTGLKALLAPPSSDKTPTLTISIAPSFVISPMERGKGYFRVFMGPAWVF